MNLKGDLDISGIAELFKTLSSQNTTGLLSVTSLMGEKLIALSQSDILVFSNPFIESPRFGEVLIARGLLSDTQMAEALMEQKATDSADASGQSGGVLSGEAPRPFSSSPQGG